LELPSAKIKKLKAYKIGIWPDDPACPVDKSISDRIREVADKLANEGAMVEEKQPKLEFSRCFDLFSSLLNAVLGQAAPPKVFKSWIEKEAEPGTSPENYQSKQIKGAIQRHRDWLMRDAERQIYRQKWQEYFEQFDVMLCPAVCVNAFPHDHSSWFKRTIEVNGKTYPYANLMGWPGLTNSVYLPSTVAPIGQDQNGLPIGLQIVGNYLEDKTCIQFAKLLKDLIGGFTPPPQFP
jgi:amidase